MPFAGLIGADLVSASPEEVRGRLEWAPERCTTGGILHGGALMALADSTVAYCAALNQWSFTKSPYCGVSGKVNGGNFFTLLTGC
jgi:acyl-coenzyme A thioesterase PaaI-like protein